MAAALGILGSLVVAASVADMLFAASRRNHSAVAVARAAQMLPGLALLVAWAAAWGGSALQ